MGIGAALVASAAVSSVLGNQGAKSAAKQQFRNQLKLNEQQFDQQKYFFNEGMDNTIQRRVADGKKVGLSALASLGAAGAQIPSVPLSRAPSQPQDGFASVMQSIIAANLEAQTMKLQAETRDQALQTELMLSGHYGRKLQANPHLGERAGLNPTSPPQPPVGKKFATVTGDTSMDSWEPGDIQLLSQEASESFESVTSTLATAAINAKLYGQAAFKYLSDRYPELEDWVINKAVTAADNMRPQRASPKSYKRTAIRGFR